MNIFQKPKVETLAKWLDVATKDLENAAKERIRAEIEAHYAEAVESHLADGLAEDQTQAAALEDLGDARIAARRFRREHFTIYELKRLTSLEKGEHLTWWLVISYLGLLLFVFADFPKAIRDHYCPWLFSVLEVFVLFVFPTLCFIAVKRNVLVARKHLLLIKPLGGYLPGCWLEILFNRTSDTLSYYCSVLLVLLILAEFLRNLRLWWKVVKVGGVSSEKPPAKPSQI